MEATTIDLVRQGVEAPAGGMRIVIVDCSSDLRQGRSWSQHPGVDTVGGARELGVAGARNRGLELAGTPFVAFLDGDAVPTANWLIESLRVLRADGSVLAVTPADGRPVRSLSFTGLPGPADESAAVPRIPAEVLAPATHAAVVHADHFRHLGSFDARLGAAAAALDLGWRGWVQGYRVLRTPDTTVLPGPGAAPAPTIEAFEAAQYDSLVTIFKNFADDSLEVVLPAAMALVAERGALRGDGFAAAAARAVSTFNGTLPEVRRLRRETQERRRRTDAELLRLFRNPLLPADGDAALASAYQAVIEAFDLEARFGTRRRIVVATPDVLTAKMAGPAIRAWQISAALAAEHEVVLVTTSKVCEIGTTLFGVEAADEARLRALEGWADVIVLQGFVLEGRPYLRDTNKVMVVDIYDPLHLEQLELERDADDWRRRLTVRNATAVLNDQLVRGDYFVCASPKQRDFWLGQMSALGRINPLTYDDDETLESLIGIVPFGLPDHPPTHTARSLKGVVPGIAPGDEVILWGGGIYNWFDPLTLVRAVDRLRHRRPKVRLFFMGMRHPNPEVAEMRMASATRQLADELGLTDVYVFFNEGWVAYDDRQNFLLEADVGVSTHLDHVETAFSFRTRILDYIWAALPIVATSGDAFAELIEADGLGLTVPAGDVDALESAMFRLLDDREYAALCRKRLDSVRPTFAWSVVLEPLLDFCRTAHRAPDLVDPEMAASLRPPPRASDPAPLASPGATAVRDIVRTHLRDGGLPQLAVAVLRRVARVTRAG